MDIIEKNGQLIDARINDGLALLRKRFTVIEQPVDPALANPVIGGRQHRACRYDIAGVGNLLAMTVRDAPENQLSSFVITPYEIDLPMLSTDFVYSQERRFFLIELYDLAVEHDMEFKCCIDDIAEIGASWNDMADFPVQPCWYDDVRPLCIAKAHGCEQDELAIKRFLEVLGRYLETAIALPALPKEDRAKKWRLNKEYADRLIDEGGVSTNLFTEALGTENTRRFFDEVFFAPSCYAR